MKILGVTSCPSGVVHTYMAAEALEVAAKEKGWDVKIETQGSMGIENEITLEEVAEADVIILTSDIAIQNEERFEGKKIIRISVSDAVKNANQVLTDIAV